MPLARRALGLVGAILAAVALGGCALPAPPLPTLTPEPDATVESVPSIRPSTLDGITALSMARAGDAAIAIEPVYFDGVESFNNLVDSIALARVDQYLGDRAPAGFQVALPPDGLRLGDSAAAGDGLRVATNVVLASGSWLGVRMRAEKDGVAIAQWTIYGDGTTDAAYPGDALVDPAQGDALLAAAGGAPPESLGSLAIATDGAVLLASGDGEPARVPAEAARPLLSDAGRSVQDAASSGAAFVPVATPGAQHVPCSLVACVALTFDDGPSPETTPGLLDLLAKEQVAATFFVEGQHVQTDPGIVAREHRDGHAVENHTWSHPDLATLAGPDIEQQISSTDAAIVAAGVPEPTLARAPYGSAGGAVAASVRHPLIYWSVDAFDWQSLDPDVFVPRVLDRIAPGGIVLMHDIYPSTVAGQETIIATLRDRGYTFVTVPQLLSGYDLVDGQVYTCRGTVPSDAGPDCIGR
ncbi:polysaccharide deacetylase family protein [Microbacterium sp. B2969]|uniref:Polysaccharide deacetylase family protein n=1 Tax=Microbacterium alkaliflavum TaxID=3248839 RepID=A0ABW7Q2N8_9MICO